MLETVEKSRRSDTFEGIAVGDAIDPIDHTQFELEAGSAVCVTSEPKPLGRRAKEPVYAPLIDPRLPRFGGIAHELKSLKYKMSKTTPVETAPAQPTYDVRPDGATLLNTDQPQSVQLLVETKQKLRISVAAMVLIHQESASGVRFRLQKSKCDHHLRGNPQI